MAAAIATAPTEAATATAAAASSAAGTATIHATSDQSQRTQPSSNWAHLPDGVQRSPLTANLGLWTDELSKLVDWVGQLPDSVFETWTADTLRAEAAFLLDGLQHGFRVVTEQPPPYDVHYDVPAEHAAAIDADLADELAAGRIFLSPAKPAWVTPHFIKLESNNKIRIIRDFTVAREHDGNPDFAAINDTTWNNKFKMMSVEDAFSQMRPLASLAKIDISKAFRAVPVHRDHWELLSYEWRGKYYTDTRLPFGLSNAPEIFCRLTAMVRLMMARRGFNVIVYVDDFLMLHVDQLGCTAAFEGLCELLVALGFTINAAKNTPPCRDLVFLGVRLQTDIHGDGTGDMAASVPLEKLAEIIALVQSCQATTSVGTRTWQRLLGRLNFVSRVIYGARSYTRRMLDALRDALKAKRSTVRITPAVRLDLKFWAQFAEVFNGHAVILAAPVLHPGFFATDASDEGIGGFFNGRTFAATFAQMSRRANPLHLQHRDLWPPHSADAPAASARPTCNTIGYKELFAVWWACALWSDEWAGLTIIVNVDNEGAKGMINSGTCRAHNPAYMKLLRAIFWLSATRGFRLHATRISTDDNILADRLSRGIHDADDYRQALETWRQLAASLPQCLPRDHVSRLRALERLHAADMPRHGRLLLSRLS